MSPTIMEKSAYEPKYIKHRNASNILASKKVHNEQQNYIENNANQNLHNVQSEQLLSKATLPTGWEYAVDHEGRTFYIDHRNQITSWQHPLSQVLGVQSGNDTLQSLNSLFQTGLVQNTTTANSIPSISRTAKPTHLLMPKAEFSNSTFQNSSSLHNSLTSTSSYYSPINSYPSNSLSSHTNSHASPVHASPLHTSPSCTLPFHTNMNSSHTSPAHTSPSHSSHSNASPLYCPVTVHCKRNSNMSLPTPSSTSSSSTSDIVKAEIAQIRQRVEILEHERLLEKELQNTKKELEEVSEAMSKICRPVVTPKSVTRQIIIEQPVNSLKIQEGDRNSKKSSRRSSKSQKQKENRISEENSTESEEDISKLSSKSSKSSESSSKKIGSRRGSIMNKSVFACISPFGKETIPAVEDIQVQQLRDVEQKFKTIQNCFPENGKNQNIHNHSVGNASHPQIGNVINNQILTQTDKISSPDASPGNNNTSGVQYRTHPLVNKQSQLQQKITDLESRMFDSTTHLMNARRCPTRYLPTNPNQPLYFSTGNFSQLKSNSNLVTQSQTFNSQLVNNTTSQQLNHSRSSQAVSSLNPSQQHLNSIARSSGHLESLNNSQMIGSCQNINAGIYQAPGSAQVPSYAFMMHHGAPTQHHELTQQSSQHHQHSPPPVITSPVARSAYLKQMTVPSIGIQASLTGAYYQIPHQQIPQQKIPQQPTSHQIFQQKQSLQTLQNNQVLQNNQILQNHQIFQNQKIPQHQTIIQTSPNQRDNFHQFQHQQHLQPQQDARQQIIQQQAHIEQQSSDQEPVYSENSFFHHHTNNNTNNNNNNNNEVSIHSLNTRRSSSSGSSNNSTALKI